MRAMRKKLNIHMSAAELLHITKGNLDCCKWRHCKNEAREIDFHCCGEVDAILIALAKILQCKGSFLPSSSYVQLLHY